MSEDELRAAAEAAMPGNWWDKGGDMSEAESAYIGLAHPKMILGLLDELTELRATVESPT